MHNAKLISHIPIWDSYSFKTTNQKFLLTKKIFLLVKHTELPTSKATIKISLFRFQLQTAKLFRIYSAVKDCSQKEVKTFFVEKTKKTNVYFKLRKDNI